MPVLLHMDWNDKVAAAAAAWARLAQDAYDQAAAAAPDNSDRDERGSAVTKRETQAATIPRCVQNCMALGPIGSCGSIANTACLCQSRQYSVAVLTCWGYSCNATEYQQGLALSAAACAAAGVVTNPSNDTTSTSNLGGFPIIYSRAAFNIQAVMSSLCTLFLVIAILIGISSCRMQAKREAMMTQRTQFSTTNKGPTNRGGTSRFGLRSGGQSMGNNQLSTFDSTRSVDFEDMFVPRRPQPAKKFTNRLTGAELAITEEWEMETTEAKGKARDSDSSGSDKHERGESTESLPPVTPTTVNMSEYGSTTRLNPGGEGVSAPTPVHLSKPPSRAPSATPSAAPSLTPSAGPSSPTVIKHPFNRGADV